VCKVFVCRAAVSVTSVVTIIHRHTLENLCYVQHPVSGRRTDHHNHPAVGVHHRPGYTIACIVYSKGRYRYTLVTKSNSTRIDFRLCSTFAFVLFSFVKSQLSPACSNLWNNSQTTAYINIYEARYDLTPSDVILTLLFVRTNWRQSQIQQS